MLKFGIYLPQISEVDIRPSEQYRKIVEIAQHAEDLSFYSGFLTDHLQAYTDPSKGFFECWTTLSALASETKVLRLGSMVTCNSFRYPSLIAKLTSTFDVISNGRLEFGMGAGWFEDEYRSFGIPFPEASIRVEQLGEAVQIVKGMWTKDRTSFSGRFYKIRDAINSPRPLQKPHPPIMMGGGGRNLLGIVARYTDRYNYGGPVDLVKEKLRILDCKCSKVRRRYDDIEKSVGIEIGFDKAATPPPTQSGGSRHEQKGRVYQRRIMESPDTCARELASYLDLGITYFIIRFIESPLNSMRTFMEEVAPRLDEYLSKRH